MPYKEPRIIIKADWKDESGRDRRGCILTRGNMRPEVWAIVEIAVETAPPGTGIVEVTEGWRPKIREGLDEHRLNNAFDFGLRHVAAEHEERRVIGDQWAARMQRRLREKYGPHYDVACHGKAWNVHIHGELHP